LQAEILHLLLSSLTINFLMLTYAYMYCVHVILQYKYFFIRTIFQVHEAHFCSKFKNNPASAEEQSLKISVNVVNKTAASAAQLAKCILLHAYSRTTTSF